MKREIKSFTRSFKFRPSVKILLDKLAIIHDRTPPSTLEQLIIAEAKRYNLIESRDHDSDKVA